MGVRGGFGVGRELPLAEFEVRAPEFEAVHTGGVGIAEGYTRAGAEFPAPRIPDRRDCYPIAGSMISANAARARLSRDFTVPRLHPVISAISSYGFPSSSRSTNTWR